MVLQEHLEDDMEIGYGYSYSTIQIGGFTDLPSVVYCNQPVNTTATQINLQGNNSSLVIITGRVVTQITGNYYGGVNQNYPGT